MNIVNDIMSNEYMRSVCVCILGGAGLCVFVKAMAFKFNSKKDPSKKDFGLGKHRVTLPEEESDRSDDDGSGTELPRTPEAKRSTDASSSLGQRLSTISGRVKSLFGNNKSDQGSSPSLSRQSPLLKEKVASGHEPDLVNLDVENCSSGRPSPSLHSRVVNKDHLFAADGVKGSLDSLKDRYGLTDDDNDSAAEGGETDAFWFPLILVQPDIFANII